MRVASLVLLSLLAAPALAEERAGSPPIAPTIADLQIGFSGHYKLGLWTPVTVTIDGGQQRFTGRIECTVQDADGVPVTYTKGDKGAKGNDAACLVCPPTNDSVPAPAPASCSFGPRSGAEAGAGVGAGHLQPATTYKGAKGNDGPTVIEPEKRQSFTILLKVGRAEAKFNVRLRSGKQTVCERTFYSTTSNHAGLRQGLAGTSQLMLVVGPTIGLVEALENKALKESVATHIVAIQEITHLPTTAIGYDGVNAVVLSAGQADSPAAQLGPMQRDALLDWVTQGGRVVLVAGEDARELLGKDGPLADFVPGRFDSVAPLRQATAIEAFCESRYPVNAPGGALDLHVPRVADVRGRILVFEGSRPTDLPLVVRSPHGLGEITFIAFDLSAAPFSDWAGRPHLLQRLFTRLSEEDFAFVEASSGRLSSLGYNDLVGQLRVSLDEFSGIRAVPFTLVAALAVLYIALIGPLDYLIVHRWLARPSLTWITLPAWIVLFTLLAWRLECEFKGESVRANSIELVDIDNATGHIRGTVWMHLYSPRIDTFCITLVPHLPNGGAPRDVKTDVSWLGLPGNALGGMQVGGDDSPFAGGYRIDEKNGTLVEMPLAVASTKSVTARWTGRVDRLVLAKLLSERDGRLEGSVKNRSGWDFSDVRLLYGRRAWVLGELNNGDTIDLATVREHLSIRTVLTFGTSGFSVPGEEGTYDPTTTNAKAILDMMMWYELVGGPGFVRLLNRYQAFCDMSEQLEMGRAVLVGVANAQGSQFHDSDGPLGTPEDKQLIIYRFLLSVDKKE